VKRRTIVAALLLGALAGVAPAAEGAGGVEYEWAVAVWPSGREFKLEIAADPQSRWRGYRYRAEVPPDEGMLFIFAAEQHQTFVMQDCLVALDMIFLDSSLHVVEIAHDRKPCRPAPGKECPTISPMRPAQYVLEVAGGIASQEKLAPGDRVTIVSEPPLK
jgi:uncharacterized protein